MYVHLTYRSTYLSVLVPCSSGGPVKGPTSPGYSAAAQECQTVCRPPALAGSLAAVGQWCWGSVEVRKWSHSTSAQWVICFISYPLLLHVFNPLQRLSLWINHEGPPTNTYTQSYTRTHMYIQRVKFLRVGRFLPNQILNTVHMYMLTCCSWWQWQRYQWRSCLKEVPVCSTPSQQKKWPGTRPKRNQVNTGYRDHVPVGYVQMKTQKGLHVWYIVC